MNINKKVTVSVRSLIVLISFIVIISVLLFMVLPHLLSLLDKSDITKVNSIISFLGNVIGGLIAGVVAYVVAKYQIQKVEEQNNIQEKRTTYIELKFLMQELLYNQNVFNSLVKSDSIKERITVLKDNLKNSYWCNSKKNFIHLIDNQLFEALFGYYDQVDFIFLNTDSIKEDHIDMCKSLNEKLIDNIEPLIKSLINKNNT